MNRFPLLPLEEEGRLNDMPLRENFVERVFAYYRWTGCLCPAQRRVHQHVYLHPCPKELMLRNHV